MAYRFSKANRRFRTKVTYTRLNRQRVAVLEGEKRPVDPTVDEVWKEEKKREIRVYDFESRVPSQKFRVPSEMYTHRRV